jgi:hypothetical protein
MEIVVNKIKLKEQKNDFDYWQNQSYATRLKALEEIRQEYHNWKRINAKPGFQRVYKIIKRAR